MNKKKKEEKRKKRGLLNALERSEKHKEEQLQRWRKNPKNRKKGNPL
jgi:hypothetical protein